MNAWSFKWLTEVSNELVWRTFDKARISAGFLARNERPIKGAKSASKYHQQALRLQKALYKRSIKGVSK